MNEINFNGLDTTVHGPIRLGVLTMLQTSDAQDFMTLKDRLKASDGALGLHLQKLEEVGYIKCCKSFVGKKPKSTYSITPVGRRALLKHIETLQTIIELVRTNPTQ